MAQVVITPSKDGSMVSTNPTLNYNFANLILEDGSAIVWRSILEFDLSSIPAGATIDSAKLRMYYYELAAATANPSGKSVSAHKMTRPDWVESEATWLIYKTGSSWTSQGGDYEPAAPTPGAGTMPASVDNWLEITGLADIIDDAIAAELACELLVKFTTETEASPSQPRFRSSGYADSDYWPQLVVDYTLAIPTVSTQAASSIKVHTAVGNGTIDATYENCDKRGICYNKTGSPTVADDKVEEDGSFSTGAFSETLTGLDENTHYYARAYAHNSMGYGYGDTVEFDTLDAIYPVLNGVHVIQAVGG